MLEPSGALVTVSSTSSAPPTPNEHLTLAAQGAPTTARGAFSLSRNWDFDWELWQYLLPEDEDMFLIVDGNGLL